MYVFPESVLYSFILCYVKVLFCVMSRFDSVLCEDFSGLRFVVPRCLWALLKHAGDVVGDEIVQWNLQLTVFLCDFTVLFIL